MLVLIFISTLLSHVSVFTEGSIINQNNYSYSRRLLTNNLYKKAIMTFVESSYSINGMQKTALMAKIYPSAKRYVHSFKLLSEKLEDDVLVMSMNVNLDDKQLKQDLIKYGIIKAAISFGSKVYSLESFYRLNNLWIRYSDTDLDFVSKPFSDKGFVRVDIKTNNDAPQLDVSDLAYNISNNLFISSFVDYVCYKQTCTIYAYASVFKNRKLLFSDTLSRDLDVSVGALEKKELLQDLLSVLINDMLGSQDAKMLLVTFNDLNYYEYNKLKNLILGSSGVISKLKEYYNTGSELSFIIENVNREYLQRELNKFIRKKHLRTPFYIKEL